MERLYQTLPFKAQGSLKKRRWKDCKSHIMNVSKETASSRHNRTDTGKDSQRLWHHTQDLLRFKTHVFPTLRRESGQKATPLTKKLFAIDTCWKSDRSLFYNSVTVYSKHTSGQNPCQGEVSQHKTDSLSLSLKEVLFVSFSFFLFVFWFLFMYF